MTSPADIDAFKIGRMPGFACAQPSLQEHVFGDGYWIFTGITFGTA